MRPASSASSLDASLNHDDGKPDEAYWQLQWWGFFEEPRGL